MHTHYPQMLSSCWISGYFKRASWPKLRGGGTHVRSLSRTEGNGKVSLCLRSITNHTKTNCQGLTSLKKSSVHTSFFCLWLPPSFQFPNPRAATCLFPSLLLQFSLVSLTQQEQRPYHHWPGNSSRSCEVQLWLHPHIQHQPLPIT